MRREISKDDENANEFITMKYESKSIQEKRNTTIEPETTKMRWNSIRKKAKLWSFFKRDRIDWRSESWNSPSKSFRRRISRWTTHGKREKETRKTEVNEASNQRGNMEERIVKQRGLYIWYREDHIASFLANEIKLPKHPLGRLTF